MKFEKNPKYNTNVLLVLLVVAFAAIVVSLVFNFGDALSFLGGIVSVLSPIIYAFILVLVLMPAIGFFESKYEHMLKKKKNYHKKAMVLSVLTTYVLVFLIVGLVIWILVSQLSRAYDFIAKFADEYFPILSGIINDISAGDGALGEYLATFAKGLKDAANDLIKSVPSFAKAAAGVFSRAVSGISDWVIAVIISIYAFFRRKKLKALLRKANAALLPPNAGSRVSAFFGELYRNLGSFLSSRAYNVIIIAVLLYIVLLIMGLEFYSMIALAVAICSFVPVVGFVVGGGIGTFVVLVTDTDKTVWFIAVLLVIGILDYAYLRPLITNKRARVSLGTTIICVFVGMFLWHLPGAILAVPLYVTVRDMLLMWDAKKKETV